MMQNLDVISVNLWNILISLANLVVLYLLMRKFLFKPVRNVLEKRQNELNEQYAAAARAEAQAEESRTAWNEKLSGAEAEASAILQTAAERAKYRGDVLVADAREKADGILRVAAAEAELERRKAAESIRQEIVEVSGALTEKLLEREITTEDHRALIDSFLEELGETDE